MNRFIRIAGAAVFATATFAQVQAATLGADGSWQIFDVDSFTATSGGKEWIDIGTGMPLNFTFTVGSGNVGVLTVVDTVFAGDTFKVYNNGSLLGPTSAVPFGAYDPLASGVFSPDDALNDSLFSMASFTLGAGSYSISGILDQSVLDAAGDPLEATSGGIRLIVSSVPEPGTLLLAGLGLLGIVARRRA